LKWVSVLVLIALQVTLAAYVIALAWRSS